MNEIQRGNFDLSNFPSQESLSRIWIVLSFKEVLLNLVYFISWLVIALVSVLCKRSNVITIINRYLRLFHAINNEGNIQLTPIALATLNIDRPTYRVGRAPLFHLGLGLALPEYGHQFIKSYQY